MMTGQQCADSGVGNSSYDLEFGSQGGGQDEGKAQLTPADLFYRIATLGAIAFLVATVL